MGVACRSCEADELAVVGNISESQGRMRWTPRLKGRRFSSKPELRGTFSAT